MRKRDILGTVVSLGPKHRLPVLREPIRRKLGDSVNTARGPLQPAALSKAGQHGVRNSGVSRLLGRQETVMLLGERDQLRESSAGHSLIVSSNYGAVNMFTLWNYIDLFCHSRR